MNFQMANGNAEKTVKNWPLKITVLLGQNVNSFVMLVTKWSKMVAWDDVGIIWRPIAYNGREEFDIVEHLLKTNESSHRNDMSKFLTLDLGSLLF